VARWEPDAAGRLTEAALELFAERGFEATPVAAIAERAGVTERTFFRHFTDKREVLFDRSETLRELLVQGVRDAPADATPIEAVAAGLDAAAGLLGDRHAFARRRHAVVTANAELQERELRKMAGLTTALADALQSRGVPAARAMLTAEAGIAVFRVGFQRWVDAARPEDLRQVLRSSLDELREVTTGA
jgi:AcrR family transcriptional regulator